MDRIQSRPNSGASPVEVANYASNIIHDQFIDIIVKHLATGAYKTTTQHPSPLSEDIARMACFESSVCPSRRKEKGWMTTAWDINDSARELVACIQVVPTCTTPPQLLLMLNLYYQIITKIVVVFIRIYSVILKDGS